MTPEEIYYDLCRRTDSPVSLGLWLRFRYAPSEYARASINPLDYNDPASYARDYACLSYLRKYKGLNSGIDKRKEALLRFGLSEEKCAEANRKLRVTLTTGRLDRTAPSILRRAQELMSAIWGDPSFDDLFGHCGWGPGATSTLLGRRASREEKMSQFPISITPSAIPYFRTLVSHNYLWLRHLLKCDVVGPASLLDCCFKSTDFSRVLTVPKDAKTDRTIAAEPTANIYLQKGIGGYLRKRLKRYGVDLDDQRRNQHLAGSANHLGLATLDLSAASDTISIGAVRLLCPPDMIQILDRLRSPAYRLEGREARFHKFSSMGNGFTFELESALFFAACRAVEEELGVGKPIGVYGDDLIVGQEISPAVVDFLHDLGFSVNVDKSFTSGRFFESCGKHYFDGVDVTPPFQKEIVDCELEYIRMANRIFDWLNADEFNLLGLRPFWRTHQKILMTRPASLMKIDVFGPAWVPGDGFFRVFNHTCQFHLSRGYRVNYLLPRPGYDKLADGGLYADSMRASHSRESVSPDAVATLGMVTLRPQGRVKSYSVRKRWVPLTVRELRTR